MPISDSFEFAFTSARQSDHVSGSGAHSELDRRARSVFKGHGPLARRRALRRYESIDTFYASPERWQSAEQDLGLTWRDAAGHSYRAALIVDTGELYSFRHVGPDGHGGSVEILGYARPAEVEAALEGWREVCGRKSSYEWLRTRSSALAARPQGRARPARRRARAPRPALRPA